jgi:choline-sulfatase
MPVITFGYRVSSHSDLLGTNNDCQPSDMNPANLVFIMSDEHSRRVLGCYGHPMIRTPNLDALAERGVRFTDAYCNSPICVPSRASFATGRHVNNIRFWDNGIPYEGSVPSWGHRLRAAGHTAVSIGKLHFRSADDDNGFTEEVMPLHVVDGIGDLTGMIRDDMPPRQVSLLLAEEAGPGDSDYQRYDDAITAAAIDWLRDKAARQTKPWVLFVSLVCPHFPLISRSEYYSLYPEDDVPWPLLYAPEERPTHPFFRKMNETIIYDRGFTEARVRRAIAAYFGMVTFLDHNIGRILMALGESRCARDTRVIYTSDHGDNLGNRGLWGKSNLFEDAAGVPLVMAGPDIPQGQVCHEPVSLVDGFPTILAGAGVPPHPDDAALPGRNLFEVARGRAAPRTVLSEYHAVGSPTGAFMIREGNFKYVHYVGMPPQLFDLAADPLEQRDLGQDPTYAGLVANCERALRAVVDPDEADARARADQAARVAAFGGRDAVLARGGLGHSPIPGAKPRVI